MPCSKPKKPSLSPDAGVPVDSAVQPCPCVPIGEIRILAITFLTNHRKLTNYDADFQDGGAQYFDPEWTPAEHHPLSHSMDTEVRLRITVEVHPANACAQRGTLTGIGPHGLVFQADYSFQGGTSTLPEMKSHRKLPAAVAVEDFSINWSSTVAPVVPAWTSNVMYVTYGEPYHDTPWENTPTLWRMRWLCMLCAGDTNGHQSMEKLHEHGAFGYNTKLHGYWSLANTSYSGQCIDLSRFWMLAAEMLGLRSGEVVYLYPRIESTRVTDYYAAHRPFYEAENGADNQRRPAGVPLHAADTAHDDLDAEEKLVYLDHSGKANNYEACFKFTHPDRSGAKKTRYYAGGSAIRDTPQEVLRDVCAELDWAYKTGTDTIDLCQDPGPFPAEVW